MAANIGIIGNKQGEKFPVKSIPWCITSQEKLAEAENPSIGLLWPLQKCTRKCITHSLGMFFRLTGMEFTPWVRLQPPKELHYHLRPHLARLEGRKEQGKVGNGDVDTLVSSKPDMCGKWRFPHLTGCPICTPSFPRLLQSKQQSPDSISY